MKKELFALPVLLLFFILPSCTNYGKEKIYDGVELYHTDQVTDAESDRLGNYLVKDGFADGNEKTVQFTKSGNTYQFRMVVKEGIDKDPAYAVIAKFMATMLSAKLFNGQPVELHFCDKYLKTLKVLVADDYGKIASFNGVELFHSRDITTAEVNALGDYLVTSHFADGKSKSVLLTKTGSTYQFRFVIKKGFEKDEEYLKNVKIFTSQLSTNVFKGAPVQVNLCDDYFTTLAVVPMS
jgi:hypothetical protein